ncbi:MAG: hypothetical protein ACLRSY_05905 [Acutalibacter sp.]
MTEETPGSPGRHPRPDKVVIVRWPARRPGRSSAAHRHQLEADGPPCAARPGLHTDFGADMTIMEEATEFIHRVKNGGLCP